MELLNIIILSLSGLMLLGVGTMRLTNPIKTYANSSGIELVNDKDLLNEIRGISALMLLGGLLILSGAAFGKMTFTSHIVAILIYLGFAVGRSLSMGMDGKPNKKLTQGLMFEVVLGAANLFGLAKLVM